jgi:hypothetical protein
MRTITLTFGIIFYALMALGQDHRLEVVSSAGGYFENNNISVSWTLGETIIDTWVNETLGIIVSSGFHQGDYKITSIPEVPITEYNVQLFPNPTTHFVNLQLEMPQVDRVNIVLVDISGRAIIQDEFLPAANEFIYTLNVTTLKSGLYLIRVYAGSGQVKVLKFIKN